MMAKAYVNTWTHDDDMQLVEAVLRNLRAGKGVIDGCKEYEEMTNGKRSVSANKYRFHTQLKEKYQKAYEMARIEGRKKRAEKRKTLSKEERFEKVMNDDNAKLTIEDVLVVMNKFKEQNKTNDNDIKLKELEEENERLKLKNKKLEKDIEDLKESFVNSEKDFKQLREALKVLENVGVKIEVPKPSVTKYAVNKEGLVERI